MTDGRVESKPCGSVGFILHSRHLSHSLVGMYLSNTVQRTYRKSRKISLSKAISTLQSGSNFPRPDRASSQFQYTLNTRAYNDKRSSHVHIHTWIHIHKHAHKPTYTPPHPLRERTQAPQSMDFKAKHGIHKFRTGVPQDIGMKYITIR